MKMLARRAKGVGMLFGHQDDTTQMPNADATEPVASAGVQPSDSSPQSDATDPSANTTPDSNDTTASSQRAPVLDNPLADETTSQDISGTPANDHPSTEPGSAPAVDETDLLALKQQALGQLTPLVDHLEQSPEEKFRTTMMMIQSTDNHSLLNDAYQAAQAISDDKTRAQALLDVINEINYFTQQKQQ